MSSTGWNSWTRREQALPPPREPTLTDRIRSWNFFGSGDSGGQYSRLPTQDGPGAPLPAPTRAEEEEGFFALSRWDRILVFVGLNLGALAMFVICFLLFPTGVFVLRPRKFAILWTMGSVLFLSSWAALMGPLTYARHLLSGNRIPFTTAYLSSIILTLYFSVGLRSTILTLISSIVQMVCLVWYLVSYFPAGVTGLQFASRMGANQLMSWLA